MELAHRVAYLLYKGDPGSRKVLHTCDNPSCVNPSHLKLGTQKLNMIDASKKGRMGHGAAKYQRIQRLLKIGGLLDKEIAALVGVSRTCVYRVKYNLLNFGR